MGWIGQPWNRPRSGWIGLTETRWAEFGAKKKTRLLNRLGPGNRGGPAGRVRVSKTRPEPDPLPFLYITLFSWRQSHLKAIDWNACYLKENLWFCLYDKKLSILLLNIYIYIYSFFACSYLELYALILFMICSLHWNSIISCLCCLMMWNFITFRNPIKSNEWELYAWLRPFNEKEAIVVRL